MSRCVPLFPPPWALRACYRVTFTFRLYILRTVRKTVLRKLKSLSWPWRSQHITELTSSFPPSHGPALDLLRASLFHPTPSHPSSCKIIFNIGVYLRWGLGRGLFPTGFSTKILCAFLNPPIRATCPVHLITIHSTPHPRITVLVRSFLIFSSIYAQV
jgi:hypothetical protein